MSVEVAVLAVENRICSRCGRIKPLCQFRRMRRGRERRHAECNACRNAYNALARRRKSLKSTKALMRAIRDSKSAERLGAAANALISGCGGMAAFQGQIQEMLQTGTPRVRALILESTVRLTIERDAAIERRKRVEAEVRAELQSAARDWAMVETAAHILRELPASRRREYAEWLVRGLN